VEERGLDVPVTSRAPPAGFDVFISYARTADKELAPALQAALQRFAKPWYRMRSLRAFRDDGTLAASAGLWSSIAKALDEARFFVLLASERAAASKWVGREIQHWLANHSPDDLQLVLTDGEIFWSRDDDDFDWDRTTALPEALRGAFEEVPRYIDARWTRMHPNLSLEDPAFRELVADLAAPVHGRQKDELIGEHVRQHRRAVRLARAAIVTLTVLLAAAVIAAVVAVRARDRAEEQARVATARQLAAEAHAALGDGQLDAALLNAAHALRLDRNVEARDALLAALNGSPHVRRIHEVPTTTLAAFAAEGNAALVGRDGRVRKWDVDAERLIETRVRARPGATSAALDGDGLRLALGYPDATVDVWSFQAPERSVHLRSTWQRDVDRQYDRAMNVAFAAAADVVAWHGAGSRVGVRAGGRVFGLVAPIEPGEAPWDVTVSSDGRYVAAAGGATPQIVVWRLAGGRPSGQARVFTSTGSVEDAVSAELTFSPTEPALLAVGSHDGNVHLWDAETLRPLGVIAGLNGLVSHLSFNERGTQLVAVDDGGVSVWSVRTRQQLGLTSPSFGSGLGVGPPRDSGGYISVGTGVVVARGVLDRAAQLGVRTIHARQEEQVIAVTDDAVLARRADLAYVWRARGREPAVLRGTRTEDYGQLAVSPNGETIVGWNGSDISPQLRVWRVGALDEPTIRTGEWAAAATVAFRGNTVIAASVDGRIWDPVARETIATLEGVKSDEPPEFDPSVVSAVFKQSGRVTLWSVDDERQLGDEHEAYGVAFTSDGSILATDGGASGRVEFWDTKTGDQARPPIQLAGTVSLVGFAEDDDVLVLGVSGGQYPNLTMELTTFDLRASRVAGEPLVVEPGGEATDLKIARLGGETVLEVPAARGVSFWTLDPDDWSAVACSIVGRDLDRQEWTARFGGGALYGEAC
jgi:WD40 repeat protein